jgi:DNA-binding NarL/FixJ family response regulator
MADVIQIAIAERYPFLLKGVCDAIENETDLCLLGAVSYMDDLQTLLQEHKPEILLLDLALPGLLNWEFIANLCCHQQINILSIADDYDKICIHELINIGVQGCLTKQDSCDRWLSAIRRLAQGKTAFSPTIVEKLIQELRTETTSSIMNILTRCQLEVLRMMAQGLNNKTIAAALGVSERTIKFHTGNIYRRLAVSGRTEAVILAWQQGLGTEDRAE